MVRWRTQVGWRVEGRGVGVASMVRISVLWRVRVKAEVSRVPSVAVRKCSHSNSPYTSIQIPGACAEVM